MKSGKKQQPGQRVSKNRAFIDTSAILRLLVKDDPAKGRAVERVLKESKDRGNHPLPASGHDPGDRLGYGEGISAQQKGHPRACGSDPPGKGPKREVLEMLAIKKEYVVTDDNKKKAVLTDIDTFRKIEEIIENFGLAKYMEEVKKEEDLSLGEAKEYYSSLKKG
jgi:hypothetical protein